jgi:hypothetical protein
MNQKFEDWRHKPIVRITRDMVEERHREFSKHSPAEANRAMRYLRALFVFASDYRDSAGCNRLGDRLSYYTTKRLLNHRTNDVTQGYVQFDVEQLRAAMQDVEDFVLSHASTRSDC